MQTDMCRGDNVRNTDYKQLCEKEEALARAVDVADEFSPCWADVWAIWGHKKSNGSIERCLCNWFLRRKASYGLSLGTKITIITTDLPPEIDQFRSSARVE